MHAERHEFPRATQVANFAEGFLDQIGDEGAAVGVLADESREPAHLRFGVVQIPYGDALRRREVESAAQEAFGRDVGALR